jgi:Putative peptidoglycan binding domain
MRTVLCVVLAAGLTLCSFAVAGAQTVQKKSTSKSIVRKRPGTASKSVSASKKASKTGAKPSTVHSASVKRTGKKGTPARTTWRNRQLAPTPERYKEIQQALAAKGYLQPNDATGTWNQNSMDALKKFQADQNIESTGKVNSLSLIALGLGPKRDTASAKPAAEPAQQDR